MEDFVDLLVTTSADALKKQDASLMNDRLLEDVLAENYHALDDAVLLSDDHLNVRFVVDYLKDTTTRLPFVLLGESDEGKSVLVLKVLAVARDLFGAEAFTVFRRCGKGALYMTLTDTLRTIHQQLCVALRCNTCTPNAVGELPPPEQGNCRTAHHHCLGRH